MLGASGIIGQSGLLAYSLRCISKKIISNAIEDACDTLIGSGSTKKLHSSIQTLRLVLPELSQGVTHGTIKEWQVQENEHVDEGNPICVIEISHAAVVIVSSNHNGRVMQIHHKAGSVIKVGEPLVDIVLENKIEQSTDISISQPIETRRVSGENQGIAVPPSELKYPEGASVPQARHIRLPQLHHADKIDITFLLCYLKGENIDQQKRLSLSYLIKAISLVLTNYPELNAHFDAVENKLRLISHHNIGVVLQTEQGLVVPNIKHTESKSIAEIAAELYRLHELAKKSKLSDADLNGGTITLSDVELIDGKFDIPSVNAPEVVIVTINPQYLPIRLNYKGRIEGKHSMQLVLTADKRATKTKKLCKFTDQLKYYIEKPKCVVELLNDARLI